jgi:hypothetical protein
VNHEKTSFLFHCYSDPNLSIKVRGRIGTRREDFPGARRVRGESGSWIEKPYDFFYSTRCWKYFIGVVPRPEAGGCPAPPAVDRAGGTA